MSTEVRWRRGTAAQHEAFIGAMSEITHDTTNNNLRVHDGTTEGGHATLMAREKGAAGGVATLDENGLVPESQLSNVQVPDKSDYGSITAVEMAEIKQDVKYLRTAGYYATGDGGDALYKRVISEPAHAGKVQSADGAWWELSEEEPSVKMFGAKADGANDDTASLQAAIDYCSAKFSGGVVRLANGVHLISSSLVWKDHVSMRGEGQTSSTIKATGPMVRMISMMNLWLSGVSLERFRVDGVQGQTVGLYVEQTGVGTGETVAHLKMSDVQFVNHLNGLDGAGEFALFDSSLTKVDFIQCTGAGAFIQGSGMNFYGCTFRVCGDGVRIAYLASGSMGGPRFFGGVWVQNNFDVTFDGPIIRPCQFYGCWMEMCATGVFATYNSGGEVNFLGVKVDGCLFQPGPTAPGSAIWNIASFNGSVTFSDCVVINSPSVNADLPNRHYHPGAGGVLSVSSSVRTNGADSWQVLPDFTTNTLVNMRGVFSDRKYPDDASAGAAGLLQGDIYYNTSTAFLTMKN